MIFKLHCSVVAWVMDYLLSRLQNKVSDSILTKTGAPRGTVLSPFIFTLFTADCRRSQVSCYLLKLSNCLAFVSLLIHGDEKGRLNPLLAGVIPIMKLEYW